jgi:hypothetical protein
MPETGVTAEQKQAVLERARGCCEYGKSQARFATQSFSTEHTPRHSGGETALDNLALACQGCNNHKYTKTEARDPISGNVVPLDKGARELGSRGAEERGSGGAGERGSGGAGERGQELHQAKVRCSLAASAE